MKSNPIIAVPVRRLKSDQRHGLKGWVKLLLPINNPNHNHDCSNIMVYRQLIFVYASRSNKRANINVKTP